MLHTKLKGITNAHTPPPPPPPSTLGLKGQNLLYKLLVYGLLFYFTTSCFFNTSSVKTTADLSEKDDETAKWTLNVLPILFTRFDLVSISCRIGSSMYICIFDLFGHFNNF